MEKRIGIIAILVEDKSCKDKINHILGEYYDLILCRQGLPMHERSISLISVMIEGTNDQIGALSGKLGRLPGVSVKSVLTKYREESE